MRFMEKTEKTKTFMAFLVGIVTFLVYLPALQNGFVNWDDDHYVYENPYIRTFDLQLLRWAFFTFHAANWHPLTWISHALDYTVWGLNPMGHHLTNILLHALNAFVVVLLVARLIEAVPGKQPSSSQAVEWSGNDSTTQQLNFSPSRLTPHDSRSVVDDSRFTIHNSRFKLITAGVTGLLFGIHPLHVESVAWVAERKDLLCAFFYLLSVMSYMSYRSHKKYKTYIFSLCFFMLALLSKPMAVSLPVVLLILDWYPFNRIQSLKSFVTAGIGKIPFLALSLISSLLTLRAQTAGGATELMEVLPLSTRLLVAARSLILYLEKMVLPVHLVPYYPYPDNVSPSSPEYILPVFLFLGITSACLVAAGKQRLWLSVWGYYLITLIPVAGIVQVGEQSMADRYTYLPGLGPLLLTGLLAAWFLDKSEILKRLIMAVRISGIAAACMLILSLASLTYKQIGIWENSISLWTYVIEEEPGRVPLAYNNRGLAYSSEGQFPEAIRDYSEAIALDPYRYRPYNNRGEVFGKLGRFNEAISDYSAAIALNQSDAKVFVNRGLVYFGVGRDRLAAFDFDRACELGDPFGCNLAQYVDSMGHKQ